jgi:GNAT superfamily N-acetyltransferase
MPACADTEYRNAYFKRYKMEVDLRDLPAPEPVAGFRWGAWKPELLDAHAEVLFASFHLEIDADIFPSFKDRTGCAGLMTEISRRSDFIAEATWLLLGPNGPVGSIQSLRERGGIGSIQNVGVAPRWRGRGLGAALVMQALHGFWRAGYGKAHLEVTAQNDAALRLYRRLGFRRTKTVYKAVADPIMDRLILANCSEDAQADSVGESLVV